MESVVLAEPLVGFRSWKIHESELRPCWQHISTWADPGNVEAVCICPQAGFMYATESPPEKRHPAPLGSCTCGIYAFYRPDPNQHEGHCWGAIVAWGHIVECEDGFKAQYARPIALLEPESDATHAASIAVIAERYALPILPLDELEQYAHMFGEVRTTT